MAALGFFWPAATTGDAADDTGFVTFVTAGGGVVVLVDVFLESVGTLAAVVTLLDAGWTGARDETEFLPFAFDFAAAWCAAVFDPAFKPGFGSVLIPVFESDFTAAFDFVSACFGAVVGGAG